jgi:hypothetical protein
MKKMKLAFAVAAAAALTSAFAAETADETSVEGQGIGAIGWTPVQVGLFAPVSFPWGFDWDVRGFDLDLFYMETVKFQGLGVSGIAARTRDELQGVLVSGLCNWNDRDVRGITATIGANLGFGDVYGINVSSFGMRNIMKGVDFNLIASYQKQFTGWQTSCVCNFSEEDCTGASFSLAMNMARVETGFQGAFINCADELHGVQVGIVNVAQECPWGFQIGLINLILDNRVKILPIFNGYFGGSEE